MYIERDHETVSLSSRRKLEPKLPGEPHKGGFEQDLRGDWNLGRRQRDERTYQLSR